MSDWVITSGVAYYNFWILQRIMMSVSYYERKPKQRFSSKNQIAFRPFLASREDFFKGSILFENNSEYVIRDNFFFTSTLKYSLLDDFEDLTIPPKNTYPSQVRSDIKDYLRNYGDGIFIGRAQFDYHLSLKKNHHLMISVGILEEMFSGIGFEYLYFKQDSNYALGFEIFDKMSYEPRIELFARNKRQGWDSWGNEV